MEKLKLKALFKYDDEMAQKTTKEKAPAKKGSKKGEAYHCSACGLVVVVDEACGCATACDLICCDTAMKPGKKPKK